MNLLKHLILTIIMTATLSGGSMSPHDSEQHATDVNVDIHKKLPKNITQRMLPEWFDVNLFPQPEDKLVLSDEQWRERLGHFEYRILRGEGTETPFINEYHNTDEEGVYVCRGCSNPLYSSTTKFHSNSGWPSFFAPIDLRYIGSKSDNNLLMKRTEIHCARCGSHLGHVFDDGPEPTGLRYCMNSQALRFIDKEAHDLIADGKESRLDFVLNR